MHTLLNFFCRKNLLQNIYWNQNIFSFLECVVNAANCYPEYRWHVIYRSCESVYCFYQHHFRYHRLSRSLLPLLRLFYHHSNKNKHDSRQGVAKLYAVKPCPGVLYFPVLDMTSRNSWFNTFFGRSKACC